MYKIIEHTYLSIIMIFLQWSLHNGKVQEPDANYKCSLGAKTPAVVYDADLLSGNIDRLNIAEVLDGKTFVQSDNKRQSNTTQ